LYAECPAGAQINFPESGRGLGHVTLQFLAVRSAILATAWLLVLRECAILLYILHLTMTLSLDNVEKLAEIIYLYVL